MSNLSILPTNPAGLPGYPALDGDHVRAMLWALQARADRDACCGAPRSLLAGPVAITKAGGAYLESACEIAIWRRWPYSDLSFELGIIPGQPQSIFRLTEQEQGFVRLHKTE